MTDASTVLVPTLLSLLAAAALYVWTALALSAVFRKSGEEGWKAWVPIYNTVVLLQLGGLSGWLVLVGLIPILGALALWIAVILACYRINVAFGFGAGMTVLAALLLPVWATVLGFGSARWVGAEGAAGPRRSVADAPGDVRGAVPPQADPGPPPPLPSFVPSPPAAPASSFSAPAPAPSAPAAAAAVDTGGWGPASTVPARPAPPLPPVAPAGRDDAPVEPITFVPVSTPRSSAPPAPVIDQAIPAAGAGAAPSSPVRDGAAPARAPEAPGAPAPASAARANDGWGGFDLGAAAELTSEVTAAVSGAPAPIAAVPGQDEPGAPAPAVTRVPAARPLAEPESWAPLRSPLPEADAFPEASGEVSAVVGAPDAGVPRSARSSVSAQHVLPEIPDDVEETVIAHRRKSRWALVLPTGSPVDLVAEVVLVGRRPAPSTAYPDAQLIEVDDGTVSKTHLRLERNGEEWSVTDLHSTNGTILIASDGAEREIVPGAPHRAPARLLLGDAELRLAPDDASR